LDIVITAIRGRVTLAGSVRNENQKQMALAAAERIVGQGNVLDRLETRSKSSPRKL
jgi:osmotically-inducible protein OsmY